MTNSSKRKGDVAELEQAHAWVECDDGAWSVRVHSGHFNVEDVLAATRTTEQEARLVACIIDLCWRVTPYGETEDGDVAAYIVSKGTVHRLISAAQGAGIPAAFRSLSTPQPGCTEVHRS